MITSMSCYSHWLIFILLLSMLNEDWRYTMLCVRIVLCVNKFVEQNFCAFIFSWVSNLIVNY